jgi:hypothetical protein
MVMCHGPPAGSSEKDQLYPVPGQDLPANYWKVSRGPSESVGHALIRTGAMSNQFGVYSKR